MDRIQLTDIAHRGAALGRLEGQVVFVPFGAPGDEVLFEMAETKKSFAWGRIRELLVASPRRVAPACRYFYRCGGCQWQHLDYAAQLEYKRQVLVAQLRRLGGFADVEVQPTLGMDTPWEYRNHVRFSTAVDGTLGFTQIETYAFLKIDYCHISHPAINSVVAGAQGKVAGLHQLVVRYGFRTGALMVQPELPVLPVPSGQGWYEEELLGHRYRISATSFFQVNTLQAERLIDVVVGQLAPTGRELVVDAYCGVGTFAVQLAGRVGSVVGIEESRSSRKDWDMNTAGLGNVRFVQGEVERVLPTLGLRPDAVVLDPPRAGLHPRVVRALVEAKPAKIVYVSCEPATLARDLRRLVDGGYELENVQPVDMFPQTYHIEAVATLVWRGVS